jgi:hypothetical protein
MNASPETVSLLRATLIVAPWTSCTVPKYVAAEGTVIVPLGLRAYQLLKEIAEGAKIAQF